MPQQKQLGVEMTKAEKQKSEMVAKLSNKVRIVRFKGAVMLQNKTGKWVDLSPDLFAELIYSLFGTGISKSRIVDIQHYVFTSSPDHSYMGRYIRMGQRVWDMTEVDFTDEIPPEDCIYSTDVVPDADPEPSQFIMDLACGKQSVYDDILQSIAPLFTTKKPDGVIWWRGNGSNGKSLLAGALYHLLGDYFSGITVKQIEDGRDSLVMNGKLGNIVKESSEGFIDDTQAYKSIGTHEDFHIHLFHSQAMAKVNGDLHHIFSANNIPTFGDKSDGARRRTLLIPFDNKFVSDPTFEDRLFTPKFFRQLLGLCLQYARRLKEQNYQYQFGEVTTETKDRYDVETNTAETYVKELIDNEIYGFTSYANLQTDYMNWCDDGGFYVMKKSVLRRAAEDVGFRKSSYRENNRSKAVYTKEGYTWGELHKLGGIRLGLCQLATSVIEMSESSTETEKTKLLENW